MARKKTQKGPGPARELTYNHGRLLEVLALRGLSKGTEENERGRMVTLQKALRANGFSDAKGPIERLLRKELDQIPTHILILLHHVLKINISYLYELSDEPELLKGSERNRDLSVDQLEYVIKLAGDPARVARLMGLEKSLKGYLDQSAAELKGKV